MRLIKIGTCSWKFPSWHKLVYSAPKGIDYLTEYATRYNTVEIDQWFWSLFGKSHPTLPKPGDVDAYRTAVDKDFRFTIKAPNSITLTHLYRKGKEPMKSNPFFLSIELLERFLETIDPLRDVLGPIMFQFEYLNRQKMTSQSQFLDLWEHFAERLPTGYPFALEVRNPNYLDRDLFTSLKQHKVIPVLVQGYWLPPVTRVYANFGDLIRAHKTVIVRLLGPDRKGIEKQTGKKWHQIVAPKDKELPAIVDMVQDMAEQGIEVYVNVNNHYEGCAPLTIEKIRQHLGGETE